MEVVAYSLCITRKPDMMCNILRGSSISVLPPLRPSLVSYPRPSLACSSRRGQGWKRREERALRRQNKSLSEAPEEFGSDTGSDIGLAQTQVDEMDEKESSETKIHVYWDLDNLPPYDCPPEEVVPNIKQQLELHGRVKSISAFGNDDTFSYIPPSVLDVKKLGPEAYSRMRLETQRLAAGLPERDKAQDHPYRCEMCGRKCKNAEDLKKHFKQLHEREFKKKLSHKPLAKHIFNKQQDYVKRYQKARLAAGAAPNKNIFLLQRLTNQGVQVKRVQRKPQAADNALIQAVTTSLWWRRAKKGQDGTAGELTQLGDSQDESLQIDSNSSSETIKEPSVALCVISNDSGFGGLLERASGMHIKTISICTFNSGARSTGGAQVFVPWEAIIGELQEDFGMFDDLQDSEDAGFGIMPDSFESEELLPRRRLFG